MHAFAFLPAMGFTWYILDEVCFSHGQLYVAAPRVGHPDNIKFACTPDCNGNYYTPNIVYKEALTAACAAAPSAFAHQWGAFDPDHGEHRTPNNDAGRCCLPPPVCVPEDVYVRLPEQSIINTS